MTAGTEGERIFASWATGMFGASRLLAVGSFILLLSPLAVPFGVFLFVYTPLAGTALALHLVGWVKLGGLSRRSRGMTWTFRVSLLGFAIGISTLPFAPVPPLPGPIGNLSPGFIVLGGFAFVPSVFGPVALAHALLFFLGLSGIQDRVAIVLIAAGSLYLVVDATFALLAQGSLIPLYSVAILTFSGLTAIGYGLVAIGWHRLSQVVRTSSAIADSAGN